MVVDGYRSLTEFVGICMCLYVFVRSCARLCLAAGGCECLLVVIVGYRASYVFAVGGRLV